MLMLKDHFDVNRAGHLAIGGCDAVELVGRFGSPLYVMDEQRIRENYRRFSGAFSKLWRNVMVCYAYKANSNLAICKILQEEGAGAEISSGFELQNSICVGVPGERTVFNGNHKSPQELRLAISNGTLINVDSIQELHAVQRIASRLRRRARIGFRVNPNVKTPTHPYIATGLLESKFGLDVASGQALKAYRMASRMKNVQVVGIHSHIGSQILGTAPFEEEAMKLMDLVARIKRETKIDIRFVDFGGGLGVPYKPEEKALPPEKLASRIVPIIRRVAEERELERPTLVFEPGRYIVADAGVLLTTVGYVKERPNMPEWVAADAGMNALIRPALYGAYHHIEVANKMRAKNTKIVNVAGPLCESGDFLGKKRRLPPIEQGDLLAVFDIGAYGLAMSSQHTAKPRPAMILTNNGKAEVIRLRETYDDLTRLDKLPSWLE
jgi:diaminopimelate decarboxylase